MREAIRDCLLRAIDQRIFPGCAVSTVVKGNKSFFTFGNYTYESNSPVVNENSIFDVASITKAIPISCLALKLIELGELRLHEPIVNYIPEFNGTYRDKITIHHLLTQTLNFAFRLSDCKDMVSQEIIKCIMNAQLQTEPGSTLSYANATSILLGMVIERCSSMSLELIAKKYFFDPLEMTSTSFYPEKFCKDRIVPTEVDNWRQRSIQGEVHDESAWALRPMIVGSAGLFSTIADLSNFLEMLVCNGLWKGKRIFREDTVLAMHTNQLPSENKNCTGLGWELNQPQTMGMLSDSNVFGKTGFTGCSIAVSPENYAGYILLSNYLYPKRRENRDAINSVRRSLAKIVLKGIE